MIFYMSLGDIIINFYINLLSSGREGTLDYKYYAGTQSIRLLRIKNFGYFYEILANWPKLAVFKHLNQILLIYREG